LDGSVRGGVTKPEKHRSKRTIFLLQRKEGKFGATLSKTTGWIHRAALKQEGVIQIGGVTYKSATDTSLVIETAPDGKVG
jgi:2,4-dienoyl-CoA reductase (NADPH2)